MIEDQILMDSRLPLVLKRSFVRLYFLLFGVIGLTILICVVIYFGRKNINISILEYIILFSFVFISWIIFYIVRYMYRKRVVVIIFDLNEIYLCGAYIFRERSYKYKWSDIRKFIIEKQRIQYEIGPIIGLIKFSFHVESISNFLAVAILFLSLYYTFYRYFLPEKAKYFYGIRMELKEGRSIRREYTLPVTSESLEVEKAYDPKQIELLEALRMKYS